MEFSVTLNRDEDAIRLCLRVRSEQRLSLNVETRRVEVTT